MKKTLILMAAAALTLTACSNEEEGAGSLNGRANEAISFRPAMGTRATETTNANLQDFYATALMSDTTLFNQVNFAKDADNFFVSQHDHYWPGDDTEVQFYAYAPSADDLGADVILSNYKKQLVSYTTPTDISEQKDFITASITGKKSQYEKSGVPLTFHHQLAQIELRAKTDNTDYIYTVAGMRIGRPETTGTFDFTTGKWTMDSWHNTEIFESSCTPVNLTSTPVSIMGPDGNAMIIPQKVYAWNPTADPDNVARDVYLSVLIRIQSVDGAVVYPFPSDKQLDENGQKRQYAWAAIPLAATWEAGKKYIYTLDFSNGAGNVDPDDPTPGNPVLGDPIKFTVNVVDWDDATSTIPMTAVK